MTQQEFLNKYGIDVTFEQMYAMQRKSRRTNNFAFTDEALHNDKRIYLDGLRYMFSACIAKQINPKNIDLGFVMDDVNFLQFLLDYESAQQDEFKKSGSTRKRAPFEGVKNLALDTLHRQMVLYNNPPIEIWVENIRKGAHLEVFRAASIEALEREEAGARVEAPMPKQEDGLLENNPDPDRAPDAKASDFITFEDNAAKNKSPDEITISRIDTRIIAFAVYKTMEEVIERRTWGWRLNPFNWGRWRQENKLMNDLEKKLGKETIRAMERNEDSIYQQLATEEVITDSEVEYFERDIDIIKARNLDIRKYDESIKARKIEKEQQADAEKKEKEVKELENLADALNNDESVISDDAVLDNDNIIFYDDAIHDIDSSVEEIDDDFKNIDKNIEIFGDRDPNVYKPSRDDANDILLIEDDVEEAKNIEPAHADLAKAKKNSKDAIQTQSTEKLHKNIDKKNKEIEAKKEKELQKEETQKQAKESLEKLSKLEKPQSIGQAMIKLKDKKIIADVVAVFSDILSKTDNSSQTGVLEKDIYRKMIMDFRMLWTEKEKMDKHVTSMFKRAYDSLPKMDTAEKLVAAQKMSDLVLNTFTPVGFEKAYEKYGNNYVIQNKNSLDIKNLTKYEGDVDELINNVKVELGIIKEVKKDAADKENVQFKKGEFEEKVADRSLKVEKDKSLVMQKVIDK